MLDTAVLGEVEHRLLAHLHQVEAQIGDDQLVLQRLRLGDDLARGLRDQRPADHADTFLDAGLRRGDDIARILIGAGLHDEVVVEVAQMLRLEGGGVLVRCVVAERDDLRPLQAHRAVGFRPAAVVADRHAVDGAHGAPDREAEIARLEIALLQMLPGAVRLMLGMTGQMHLAVLADDTALVVHQDRGVEMVAILGQLGIAQIEADAPLRRLLEQRQYFLGRHLLLEEGLDLLPVFHIPAREEGGQRQFREHHVAHAARLRLAHHLDHSVDAGGTGFSARDRAHLGGGGGQDAGHFLISSVRT